MGWKDRKLPYIGSVHFRGTLPPRVEDFAFLKKRGFTIAPHENKGNAHWTVRVGHTDWGKAIVGPMRDAPRLPRDLIEFDPFLTAEEKAESRLGETTVTVVTEGRAGDLLRDRKNLLRFMRAIMSDDGVVAVDHSAQRLWSREALDYELSHDADLDVSALYALHVVAPDEPEDAPPTWLHTHGLAEMGFFDFDVLNPSEGLWTYGIDAVRALAFAIVEGEVAPSTPVFTLASPGGDVRLVEIGEFLKKADPATRALRMDADDDHNNNRAVVCEPVRGLLSRWFGKVKPASFLSGEMPDDRVLPFSNDATELMAKRAQSTLPQFRKLSAEFAEFSFPNVAKIAYTVDGGNPGDPTDREHLWFEVHGVEKDRVDATLASQPIGIARMKAGERAWHGLDRVTDWAIVTPIGMINPRDTRAARAILADREEFAKVLRAAQQAGEA
jgi:hypothetical protein